MIFIEAKNRHCLLSEPLVQENTKQCSNLTDEGASLIARDR